MLRVVFVCLNAQRLGESGDKNKSRRWRQSESNECQIIEFSNVNAPEVLLGPVALKKELIFTELFARLRETF